MSTGPYAWVRNPIYLGNLMQWRGFGALSGVSWAAAWFVLGAVLYWTIVPWEERQLAGAWPAQFQEWSERVGRWWPRRSSLTPATSAPETAWDGWSAARSERSTLLVWILIFGVFSIG